MKRFISAVLLIIICVTMLPTEAFAVETGSFRYTDSVSGMSFVVPENWVESAMFEEREYIDAKFTSSLDKGLCIIFMSEDMLSESFLEEAGISSLEKILISRGDLDNSLFTKDDVAAMYGESPSAVSMDVCGNKEYFVLETEQVANVYGVSVLVPLTVYVRCENGYMYMFQFNGAKGTTYFKDFENLVKSAEFPIVEDDSLAQRRIIGVAFLGVMVCVVVIFVLLRRRTATGKGWYDSVVMGNDEEALSVVSMETRVAVTVQNNFETTKKKVAAYCCNCGCEIQIESRFCHNCGARVVDKERE